MRTSFWIQAAALAALVFSSAPASAIPSIRLSWDQCDPLIVNRAWTGPGTYAVQVSGIGFAETYSSLYVGFSFFPHRVVPAWDFSTVDYWTGLPGCQGPARMAILNAGGGCPILPGQVDAQGMYEGGLTNPFAPTGLLAGLNFTGGVVPDPAQRYGLLRFVFDHTNSVAGPSGAGTCGYVEEPMCMHLTYSGLSNAAHQNVFVALEQEYLSWQDPANALGCPGASPAQPKTWGALKATYR
jgi:hypothetical protein